ncbi:hypothetical protein RhiJN_09460 [Ceratobasidium sp. AG-Ba]|nr:hypothetical protein RhiJN_09460 [Ceratobasidium sp. AG-Ba]QRW10254.1 hypothetical protein RhiLY_09253 [Ceratobasidium sp. AG-Ba]
MADANIEEREIDFEEYAGMFGAVPDSDDEDENPPLFAGSVDFEFDNAKFLLDVIYKSRDSFLGASSFAAGVGLFLVVSMIRLQLCYFARRVYLADEATSKLIDLLDINHRYFLISSPKLRASVSFLLEKIHSYIKETGSLEHLPLDLVNSKDTTAICSAFLRQLLSPPHDKGIINFAYLLDALEWVDGMIYQSESDHLYPLLVAGLFGRLWDELFFGKATCIRAERRIIIIHYSRRAMQYLCDRLDKKAPTPTPSYAIPDIILCLPQLDFVNLMATPLVFTETEARLDEDEAGLSDIFVSGNPTSAFLAALAQHSRLFQSRFSNNYDDWLKILCYIRQNRTNPSTFRNVMTGRAKRCESVWLRFGKIFGYEDPGRNRPDVSCSYARCIDGATTRDYGMLICAGCLEEA